MAEPRSVDDSARWVAELSGAGRLHEAAVTRLHELLLRAARAEVRRRSVHLGVVGPELDDLAHQAAADALVAVLAKLPAFRGESRFTTWAYKFVVFEVSSKVSRHFWWRSGVALDAEDWNQLPDGFGFAPDEESEYRGLLAALRRAVDEELTDRQRRVFVAIVLNGVALDVVVAEFDTNRNAVYKVLFDARRKLRAALVADGQLDDTAVRRA